MEMFENVLTRFEDKILQTDNILVLRLYWKKFINIKLKRLIGLYNNTSIVPKFPESRLQIFPLYVYGCKHKINRKVPVVEQFSLLLKTLVQIIILFNWSTFVFTIIY